MLRSITGSPPLLLRGALALCTASRSPRIAIAPPLACSAAAAAATTTTLPASARCARASLHTSSTPTEVRTAPQHMSAPSVLEIDHAARVRFTVACPADAERVLRFTAANFGRGEPLSEACGLDEGFWRAVGSAYIPTWVRSGMSVVCESLDTNEIVGFVGAMQYHSVVLPQEAFERMMQATVCVPLMELLGTLSIGYATMYRGVFAPEEQAELLFCTVSADGAYRGKGLGTRLVRHVQMLARAQRYKIIVSETTSALSTRMMQRAGFFKILSAPLRAFRSPSLDFSRPFAAVAEPNEHVHKLVCLLSDPEAHDVPPPLSADVRAGTF